MHEYGSFIIFCMNPPEQAVRGPLVLAHAVSDVLILEVASVDWLHTSTSVAAFTGGAGRSNVAPIAIILCLSIKITEYADRLYCEQSIDQSSRQVYGLFFGSM